jgi:hypothetical protein
MADANRGIYQKYYVERMNDPAGKHNDCEYFVLDWQHDPYTIPAVLAYADACEGEYPELAADLRLKASEVHYARERLLDICGNVREVQP